MHCGVQVKSNSNNASFVITAGHCLSGAYVWYTDHANGYRQEIGPAHNAYFPGTDFGLITVRNPSAWSPAPWVAVWGNGPSLSDNFQYSISGPSGSTLGATICRSGATTGSTCGQIVELGYEASYPEGKVQGLGVLNEYDNFCSRPGDSGGPYWANGRAYGLHSGTRSDCRSLYQGISAALNTLNVRLRTVTDP